MIIQSLIMVGIALLAGARFAGGVLGVAGLIGIAALISAAFASLSLAFALVTRQEETLIGTLTFLQLPLSFISSTLIAKELMPAWMETAANFNPVEWAVEAGRAAALGEGGFDVVVTRAGLLAGLCGARRVARPEGAREVSALALSGPLLLDPLPLGEAVVGRICASRSRLVSSGVSGRAAAPAGLRRRRGRPS